MSSILPNRACFSVLVNFSALTAIFLNDALSLAVIDPVSVSSWKPCTLLPSVTSTPVTSLTKLIASSRSLRAVSREAVILSDACVSLSSVSFRLAKKLALILSSMLLDSIAAISSLSFASAACAS